MSRLGPMPGPLMQAVVGALDREQQLRELGGSDARVLREQLLRFTRSTLILWNSGSMAAPEAAARLERLVAGIGSYGRG